MARAAPTEGLGIEEPVSCYPAAQCSQEQIVADKELFMNSLKLLHEQLGTPFRVPQVCGKDLDLHLLYTQVTRLGGLEVVINGKRWSEVAQPFHFPDSFTSKSFTLRRMYSKLLFGFEQVYFHRNTGPLVSQPGESSKLEASGSGQGRKRKRLKSSQAISSAFYPPLLPPALTAFYQGGPAGVASLVGAALSGQVDAKFDCGYFVTVNVSNYSFQGVLYLPRSESAAAEPSAVAVSQPAEQGMQEQPFHPSSPGEGSSSDPEERRQEGEAVTPAQPFESAGPAGRPAHVHEPVTVTRRDVEMQLTPFLASGVHQQDPAVMPLRSRSALQCQPSQVRIAAAETESTTMPAPRLSQTAHLHHASGLSNPFHNPFQIAASAQATSARVPASPVGQQYQQQLSARPGATRLQSRHERLEDFVDMYYQQRQRLHHDQPQQHGQPFSEDPRSFGREAATLNQLLHMADNEPDTSNPHLALLQSLQSQLPSRIVSGQWATPAAASWPASQTLLSYDSQQGQQPLRHLSNQRQLPLRQLSNQQHDATLTEAGPLAFPTIPQPAGLQNQLAGLLGGAQAHEEDPQSPQHLRRHS